MRSYEHKRTTSIFVIALLIALGGSVTLASEQESKKKIPDEEAKRKTIAEVLVKGDTSAAVKMLSELQGPAGETGATAEELSGSVFFEEIRACGLYPQETRLECVVEVKRRFGYAGPVGSFGSMEHVYFCIDWNNNGNFDATESVGRGIVHMHDEAAGTNPPWHYAVYRDFDPPGGLRTANQGAIAPTTTRGPTRRARAILSWVQVPTGCNFSPVWGNIFDFRVRFDPIR